MKEKEKKRRTKKHTEKTTHDESPKTKRAQKNMMKPLSIPSIYNKQLKNEYKWTGCRAFVYNENCS